MDSVKINEQNNSTAIWPLYLQTKFEAIWLLLPKIMTGSYPVGYWMLQYWQEQVQDPQKYFVVEKWCSMKYRKWGFDSIYRSEVITMWMQKIFKTFYNIWISAFCCELFHIYYITIIIQIRISAFAEVEWNGEGWRLRMELGFHTCQNEFQHSFLHFFCIHYFF